MIRTEDAFHPLRRTVNTRSLIQSHKNTQISESEINFLMITEMNCLLIVNYLDIFKSLAVLKSIPRVTENDNCTTWLIILYHYYDDQWLKQSGNSLITQHTFEFGFGRRTFFSQHLWETHSPKWTKKDKTLSWQRKTKRWWQSSATKQSDLHAEIIVSHYLSTILVSSCFVSNHIKHKYTKYFLHANQKKKRKGKKETSFFVVLI